MDNTRLEDAENISIGAKADVDKAESALRKYERNVVDTGAQAQFRQEFSQLESGQKGSWGERAVINEASAAGHAVLIEHWDTPHGHGFDCVSYDPATKELHIWESKNNGIKTSPIENENVTAWQDQWKVGTKNEGPRPGYKDNWGEVLRSVPEGPVRDVFRQSVAEGKVTFHLRLGPDTRVSGAFQKELEASKVPGSKYDWDRYTYQDMLKIGSGA